MFVRFLWKPKLRFVIRRSVKVRYSKKCNIDLIY